jgi:catechol 2,3-dioxygenase-like lactoylglutathione lyase family enzyme
MREPLEYRLQAVRVFTADIGRALDFYTKSLGMKVESVDEESRWP